MQLQNFYSSGKSPFCRELLNLLLHEGIIQLKNTKGAKTAVIVRNTIYIVNFELTGPLSLACLYITGLSSSIVAVIAVVRQKIIYQSIKLIINYRPECEQQLRKSFYRMILP